MHTSPSARRRAVPCRDLPELDAWRAQRFIKDALLQETGGGAAFVARAAETLSQTLLAHPRDGTFLRLLKQGYTHEQVAHAFAEAWLRDEDHFHLPRRRPADSRWVRQGPPWLAALATILLVVIVEIQRHHETVMTLFFTSSFLIIPLLALAWVYGVIWRAGLRLVFGAGPDRTDGTPASPMAASSAASLALDRSAPLAAAPHPGARPMSSLYRRLEAFDPQRHAELRLRPTGDYAFAAALTSVPLTADELPAAVSAYPIVFPSDVPVRPTAILGLTGENHFLDAQHQWRVPVVPAQVRHYPFTLAQVTGAEPGRMTLALDRAAAHFEAAPEEGSALVTPDGEPSALVIQIQEHLVNWERQRLATETVLAELETAAVLVARPVHLELPGGIPHTVDGLRMVDLERLTALDDATLARWVRNGTMQVVYLHLASLRHFSALVD